MNDGNWFAPKRFGYGSGLPISWQGWAVTIAFFAVVACSAFALMPRHPLVWIAIVAGAAGVFTLVCAQHTRGGWKWRWNDKD